MHDEGYHGESDLCPYVSPYEGYAIADNLDPLALQQVAERARDCMCPPGAECSLTQFFSVARSAAVTTWQSERNVTQHLFAGLEVAVHALQEMPGARMLLLTSRGFFAQRTDPVVNRITDSALRAHVVISSLSTKGLGAAMTRGQYAVQQQAENQTMVAFAESTGGRFIKNNNDLLSSLESLATPETAYVLTFSPDPAKNDGKFHRLRVEVRASGHFTVSAREGYFALRAPPR
jgi:VWFA-related protein